MYIQSAQNQLSSFAFKRVSLRLWSKDWNSECSIPIAMNIPTKLRNPVGNFSRGGEFLNIAGLRLGKLLPATLSVNYFLQTNKKNFHHKTKKETKNGKKKKDAELLSYNIWIPIPVLNEKIKACHSLLRKPPKLTS